MLPLTLISETKRLDSEYVCTYIYIYIAYWSNFLHRVFSVLPCLLLLFHRHERALDAWDLLPSRLHHNLLIFLPFFCLSAFSSSRGSIIFIIIIIIVIIIIISNNSSSSRRIRRRSSQVSKFLAWISSFWHSALRFLSDTESHMLVTLRFLSVSVFFSFRYETIYWINFGSCAFSHGHATFICKIAFTPVVLLLDIQPINVNLVRSSLCEFSLRMKLICFSLRYVTYRC